MRIHTTYFQTYDGYFKRIAPRHIRVGYYIFRGRIHPKNIFASFVRRVEIQPVTFQHAFMQKYSGIGRSSVHIYYAALDLSRNV